MKLDYPKYEIIFALQDEHDEAIPVVQLVMHKYPAVSARIIISEPCWPTAYEASPTHIQAIRISVSTQKLTTS
jgi:hypothetical protein